MMGLFTTFFNSSGLLSKMVLLLIKRNTFGHQISFRAENKVLENLQNFSEQNAELSIIFPECFSFYSEKLCEFSRTLCRKFLYT